MNKIKNYGLSLVELVIAIVIIGLASAFMVETYNMFSNVAVDQIHSNNIVTVADNVMLEIESSPYLPCDPEDPKYQMVDYDPENENFPLSVTDCTPGTFNAFGPETISGVPDICPYDNIDDYHGMRFSSDMTAFHSECVADPAGRPVRPASCSGYQMPTGYAACVVVDYPSLDAENTQLDMSSDVQGDVARQYRAVLLLTVHVTHVSGITYSAKLHKVRAGARDI